MKVIASSVRKGNVLDIDGKLCVVLTAESFHPGKGTPTTQIDMRRIADGVKISQRYKTVEQVERAIVEDREHTFLYQDGEGFHFMNSENYDQITLQDELIGDGAAYLQPEMKVMLSMHDGNAVAIQLPQKVILEITETEPGDQGPDRVLVLQARHAVERRAYQRAAVHRRGHPRRGDDGRRVVRRAREGLVRRNIAVV